MSKNISGDAVNALLAEHASLLGNTSKKTSRSSRRKPKSSVTSTKPTKVPDQKAKSGRLYQEDATDADNRLREFIQGSRSTTLPNGEEHWYDSEENRNYTLEEIGNIMGVSRERVRQIEEHALRRMWRLMDIMSKREGVTKDEWMQMLGHLGKGEQTIYFPDAHEPLHLKAIEKRPPITKGFG